LFGVCTRRGGKRRILQQHGFVEVRRHGSHIVMLRRTEAGTVTVPIPDHRDIAVGTLLSIIRPSEYREQSSKSDLSRVSVASNCRIIRPV
jgi:predicted RNA binding protein YcfA (HicA-like mRNA interferase family)